MPKEVKPLYTLSVEEFKQLTTQIVEDCLLAQQQPEDKSDILDVEGAAKMLGYSVATLYSKVSKEQVPTLSRGRPLLFSKTDLLAWLKDGKPKMNKTDSLEDENCEASLKRKIRFMLDK